MPRTRPIDRGARELVRDVEVGESVFGSRIQYVLVAKVTAGSCIVRAGLRVRDLAYV